MLEVILDYGRRFPDVKIKDLGLNFTTEVLEYKISSLKYWNNLTLSSIRSNKWLVFRLDKGELFFGNTEYQWEKVPSHVILRFLTEGKEDLI